MSVLHGGERERPATPGPHLLVLTYVRRDGWTGGGTVSDPNGVTELAVGGTHVVVFTTGRGTVTGSGIVPVIKVCGSFLVVEYMRQGLSPKKACIKALQRIIENQGVKTEFQVGFVALDISGRYGAASLEDGFEYAVADGKGNELYKAEYID